MSVNSDSDVFFLTIDTKKLAIERFFSCQFIFQTTDTQKTGL